MPLLWPLTPPPPPQVHKHCVLMITHTCTHSTELTLLWFWGWSQSSDDLGFTAYLDLPFHSICLYIVCVSDAQKRKSKWDSAVPVTLSQPVLLTTSASLPGVVSVTTTASGTKTTVISAVGTIQKKAKQWPHTPEPGNTPLTGSDVFLQFNWTAFHCVRTSLDWRVNSTVLDFIRKEFVAC